MFGDDSISLEDFVSTIGELQGWSCVIMLGLLCRFIENNDLKDRAKHALLQQVLAEHEMSRE